jgi:ribosome-associated protein
VIPITDDIVLDEREIDESFIRASGPGGQNVNKVASAVQLRFDIRHSRALPEAVRDRLERLAGHRVSQEGVLVITAQRFRSQERNRADALGRLVALIQRAATPPCPRRPTRPAGPRASAGSTARRAAPASSSSALRFRMDEAEVGLLAQQIAAEFPPEGRPPCASAMISRCGRLHREATAWAINGAGAGCQCRSRGGPGRFDEVDLLLRRGDRLAGIGDLRLDLQDRPPHKF